VVRLGSGTVKRRIHALTGQNCRSFAKVVADVVQAHCYGEVSLVGSLAVLPEEVGAIEERVLNEAGGA